MKYPASFLITALTLAALNLSAAKNIVLKFENGDHFENRRPLYSEDENRNYIVRSDRSKKGSLIHPIYEIIERHKKPDRVKKEKKYVDLTRMHSSNDGIKPTHRPIAAVNYLDFSFPNNAFGGKNNNILKSALTNYNLLLNVAARKMIPFQKRGKRTRYSWKESDDSYSGEDSDSSGDSDERHTDRDVSGDENSEEANEENDEDSSDDDRKLTRFEVLSSRDSAEKASQFGKDEHYTQALTRFLKTEDIDWRRTLPVFLPKRVHWDTEDYKKLRNYWIHGPRGRVKW